ncbi:hypothetical protein STEG23_013225, partial [Scotinomys teguina]
MRNPFNAVPRVVVTPQCGDPPKGFSVIVCLDAVHNAFEFTEYILNSYCAPNAGHKMIHKTWLMIFRSLCSGRGNRLRSNTLERTMFFSPRIESSQHNISGLNRNNCQMWATVDSTASGASGEFKYLRPVNLRQKPQIMIDCRLLEHWKVKPWVGPGWGTFPSCQLYIPIFLKGNRCFTCMHICVMALDPLELELKTVVSYHVSKAAEGRKSSNKDLSH